jgi:hypothetical protein
MTQASLQVLAKFASADLPAFGRLPQEVFPFFPTLYATLDGPPVYNHDYWFIDLNKALAAATSRGLDNITSFFSSSSSSSSCPMIAHRHHSALFGMSCCVLLCDSIARVFLTADTNFKLVECPEEIWRRQVQLAVAFKSAGVLLLQHELMQPDIRTVLIWQLLP